LRVVIFGGGREKREFDAPREKYYPRRQTLERKRPLTMLLVPLASVPAVEMCCESSAAGMRASAIETL